MQAVQSKHAPEASQTHPLAMLHSLASHNSIFQATWISYKAIPETKVMQVLCDSVRATWNDRIGGALAT